MAKLQSDSAPVRAPESAPVAAPVPEASPAANSAIPSEAELMEMISEAAYYRAEKRGFSPGLEADDWIQAEAEVMARLQALRGRP
jgi:Protein of unknown function (DUF2934)